MCREKEALSSRGESFILEVVFHLSLSKSQGHDQLQPEPRHSFHSSAFSARGAL
jgi:hypothetical protein